IGGARSSPIPHPVAATRAVHAGNGAARAVRITYLLGGTGRLVGAAIGPAFAVETGAASRAVRRIVTPSATRRDAAIAELGRQAKLVFVKVTVLVAARAADFEHADVRFVGAIGVEQTALDVRLDVRGIGIRL